MKIRILLAVVGVALVLMLVRPQEGFKPQIERRIALGTLIEIKLYVEAERADSLMDLAYAEIDRIDSLMSHYSTTSQLAQINDSAANTAVACSAEIAQVLGRSMQLGQRAGGAFDVTLGRLTGLWNFPEANRVPDAAQITAALGTDRSLELNWQAGQPYVRLGPDAQLDLGGAAKGFAVDQAALRLQQAGVACGLIEAGGDIFFWGVKPNGQGWRFGVQHPRQPQQIIQAEDLGLPALATSGDYEQFFTHQGRRFHHLLDPATGYPGHNAVSATVWTTTALDADILATAVFILGPEKGLALVEELPQTEALIFFERDGNLQHQVSSGAAGHLSFNTAQ